MSRELNSIKLRNIELEDYHLGYFELLSKLTTAPKPSFSTWSSQFNKIVHFGFIHIYVLHHTFNDKIIGSLTLLIEPKFIRNCRQVGHIEDVVIDPKYQSLGLGKKLLEHCISEAQQYNCYKITLDCHQNNVGFYQKCGLSVKELQMVKYL